MKGKWDDTWGTGERFLCDTCGGEFVRLYSDTHQHSAVDTPLREWHARFDEGRLLIEVEPMPCIDCWEDPPS